MLTPQQSEILSFVKKQGVPVTFRQVVDEFEDNYHSNGEQCIGQILGRMVNAGLLQRHRKGVYILGPGKKQKPPTPAPEQPTLF